MPGYYSYDLYGQYQTYDITEMLGMGTNEIAFILGNGWYRGRFVFDGGYSNIYGTELMVTAYIRIEYQDGSIEEIKTNQDWKACESYIFENGIYDGEVINTEHDPKELKLKTIDSDIDLKPRNNVPLRIEEEIQVKEIIMTPTGEMVLDFGEAITGWVEVKAENNTKYDFSLLYGEVLQNGNFYNENYRTAKSRFQYTGKAKEEWIRPHFTYYGFRYVKIVGLRHIEARMFKACRLMSSIEKNGHIVTSNHQVNQLIENALRSQKCNYIDIPLDCPQRDERMGWTGDVTIFARTAFYQMDSTAFLLNYMRNLRKEQVKLGGAVPFFVPKPKIEIHEGINPFLVTAGACTWGDAATIVPWEMYLHTQDISILTEMYPVMKDWVQYVEKRTWENDVPYLWQNDSQLGDWLALDNGNINNPIGQTDHGLIASAYYYHSVCLCAKVAKILDVKDDYCQWEELKTCIKRAFIKEYLTETGKLKSTKTQTAYALILYYDLYNPNQKENLKDELQQQISNNHGYLNTGFVGTSVLCGALTKAGLNHMAYQLLLNEEYPGWLHEVKLGATSIWERWNSLEEDGSISGTGMNSLNHYAYGCIAGWMYEYMCGYTWDEEGQMMIQPHPDKRIQYVQSSYSGPNGKIDVSWKYLQDGRVQYDIGIPFQDEVIVKLPDGECRRLETGQYSFVA